MNKFKLLSRLNSKLINRSWFHSYSPEPAHPIPGKSPKWMSAEDAVKIVKSGDKIFLHQAAAIPKHLVAALTEHGKSSNIRNVSIYQLLTFGAESLYKPEMEGIFRANAFFVIDDCRKAVNEGRGDYLPIFLSETPLIFKNQVQPDVGFVSVTPADEHGFHSLGPTVDFVKSALSASKYIVGQVNNKLPRTFGDAIVHTSHFDVLVSGDEELPEVKPPVLTDIEKQIGKHIADNLVEDGSTLQTGIGAIPDAVLNLCHGYKDLGIFSEMISDGVVDLYNSGAITNRFKTIEPGKSTITFAIGTKKLFNFLHNNPTVSMRTCDFTNNQFIIAKNPKMVAINSCIEIDILGQVCSDTIGSKVYSGFGGQVDFIRGAALSEDGKGKAILALSSQTNKGQSKIVPFLKDGASVTTTRAHVHHVVTEYGLVDLFGKNYRQRAYELIKISHPNHREALEKAAFERLKCMPSP